MPPTTSQNNIINQMSNISLGDQQRPPSVVIMYIYIYYIYIYNSYNSYKLLDVLIHIVYYSKIFHHHLYLEKAVLQYLHLQM